MRQKLIEETVALIAGLKLSHPIRVGIDGASASGKTHFADSLVAPLQERGRHVIRASIDGFHHPQEIRYRQGKDSVAGYVEDSFDKCSVVNYILNPLGPSGNREYKVSHFDFVSDEETLSAFEKAQPDSILIFEGVMLFCDRLVDLFDFRIFVDAAEERILRRALVRDSHRLGGEASVIHKYRNRYLPGQRKYFEKHRPAESAHLVVDNNDCNAPYVVSRRQPGLSCFR